MAKYPFATQIFVTEEMRKAIKETAKRMSISQAEWVRRAIQDRIDKDKWA